MTDYGIKVSKPGFDAKTAGVTDMVLHSEHYGMKIVSQGTVNITVTSGSGGSNNVSHSLGYIPGFLAFCKMTGSKVYPPSSWDYEGNFEQFIAESDSNSVDFSVDSNADSNYTAVVYYYILADPGQ